MLYCIYNFHLKNRLKKAIKNTKKTLKNHQNWHFFFTPIFSHFLYPKKVTFWRSPIHFFLYPVVDNGRLFSLFVTPMLGTFSKPTFFGRFFDVKKSPFFSIRQVETLKICDFRKFNFLIAIFIIKKTPSNGRDRRISIQKHSKNMHFLAIANMASFRRFRTPYFQHKKCQKNTLVLGFKNT